MRKQSYPAAFYIAGFIAAGFGVVSAFWNGWFGFQIGQQTPFGEMPYLGTLTAGHFRAATAVGADLLKDFLAVLIIVALVAKSVRWWLRGVFVLICAAFWFPLVASSWTNISGAAALISANGTSVRASEIDAKRRLVADEARLEKRNPWTPEIEVYRDTKPDALLEKIEAHKLDLRWKTSKGCASADGGSERAYCREYHVLISAQKTATDQVKDHEELTKIKAKLAEMTTVPLVANPAAATLAKTLGTDEDGALVFTSGLGAFLIESIPTGLPALLYFFAATILARPKEEEPVVAMPAPRQRARTRIALASVPDSAVHEVAMAETKPRKSALKKIEEGLAGALSIAKAEAKPVDRPASPEPHESADANSIIGAAIRSLQPTAARRPDGKIAHAEIMEAIAGEGGADIDPRTLSAFLKRAKGITKIEGDRSRLNGQRQTWYQIAGRPKLESVA
jgi:hypothetical protein